MNNTKYNVIITDEFYRLLDMHIEFLARVSVKAARKLNREVLEKTISLSEFPERYPIWLTDYALNIKYRNILVEKRYLIIYYVDGEDVFVDYLFDSRMDNERFL